MHCNIGRDLKDTFENLLWSSSNWSKIQNRLINELFKPKLVKSKIGACVLFFRPTIRLFTVYLRSDDMSLGVSIMT